jgi:trans-aconitate methyltransferase
MIRLARARSADYPNIEFVAADVREWDFPAEGFDCIASIATLHHLPLVPMLKKMRDALNPAGVLAVLDLYRAASVSDLLVSAAAVPLSIGMRLVKRGRLREPKEVRDIWAEHGRHDIYLTMGEVRTACAAILPGAKVTRHLLWRYSIIWKKP